MRCEELHNLLTAWVDGELGAEQVDLLTEHTDQCADCRDLLAARRDEQNEWRTAWQTQAPASLHRDTLAKPARRTVPLWIPWAAAAVLVLMLSPLLRTDDNPAAEAFAKPCNLITHEAVGADRTLVLSGRLL